MMADQDLSTAAPEEIAKAGIKFVPEGRRVFAQMTVEENLRLGAFMWRRGHTAKDLERRVGSVPGPGRAEIAGGLVVERWPATDGRHRSGDDVHAPRSCFLTSRPVGWRQVSSTRCTTAFSQLARDRDRDPHRRSEH